MIDYNFFLLIISGLALIGGLIFGLFYNRIFPITYKLKKNKPQSQNSKVKEEEEEEVKRELTQEECHEGKEEKEEVPKPTLLKKNFQLLEEEIKIYKFEKDLISHAIENILIASKKRTIDSFERDRLLLKYNEQLQKLNKQMEKIQSEIDVTKLIDLRNDLASLLDNKISNIDEKIKEITSKIETKSKILETKNYNKKNNNIINNNFGKIASPSDIEEIVDSSFKSRKIISVKNNNINKKKETFINDERKKIINLKDQVLTALNRLDKAGIIKKEIENEVVTIQSSHNSKEFLENAKGSLPNRHDLFEIDDKASLNQLEYKTFEKSNKEKVNLPKIFNSETEDHSKNNSIKDNGISSTPFLKSNYNQESKIKSDNQNSNRIKIGSPFIDKNQETSNYNNNKNNNISSNPLFNLLNQRELKYNNYYFNAKDSKKEEEEEYSKDKQPLGNDNPRKFKFPLGFIFSKNKKEKIIENGPNDNNTKRKDSLNNILE